MSESSTNNKLIAKNTAFLYLRMFIMMIISLFTSRIVLDVLGASDFGIYSIIGGIVVMFSFINGALTSASQRFISFYLGKDDYEQVKKVFCMSMNTYYIISLILLLLSETIGLWFVNTQLNIPLNRLNAANWVYQISILTFISNLLRIPYNSSIIAYEKMNFFAYFTIFEATMKLFVVFILYISKFDKLVLYSLLYLLITIFTNIIYTYYCKKEFKTSRFSFIWDKKIFKDIFNFSGWSLLGSVANVAASQGVNIILNIFAGVKINAASGIANQVSTQLYSFISNFQTAFNPQIIKTYASNQTDRFNNLIFQTSRFSYFLFFILAYPIILTTKFLLSIWLVEVPDYTVIFCQLQIIFLLLESITAPLWMAVTATGKIRNYQILMSFIIILNFPLSFIFLKLDYPFYSIYAIRIIINVLTILARVLYMNKNMAFSKKHYLNEVILRILKVSIIAIPIPLFITLNIPESFLSFIIIFTITLLISVLSVYIFGLSQDERLFIKTKFKKIVQYLSFTK